MTTRIRKFFIRTKGFEKNPNKGVLSLQLIAKSPTPLISQITYTPLQKKKKKINKFLDLLFIV